MVALSKTRHYLIILFVHLAHFNSLRSPTLLLPFASLISHSPITCPSQGQVFQCALDTLTQKDRTSIWTLTDKFTSKFPQIFGKPCIKIINLTYLKNVRNTRI
jgi:hypothetical protein